MKITKRRVTKTNRIKRKYSKKRTKTRHSRKRVFSKKRRKTNKKKKRGGFSLINSLKKNYNKNKLEKKKKELEELISQIKNLNDDITNVTTAIDNNLVIDTKINKLIFVRGLATNSSEIKQFLNGYSLKTEFAKDKSFRVINQSFHSEPYLLPNGGKKNGGLLSNGKKRNEGLLHDMYEKLSINNIDLNDDKKFNEVKETYEKKLYKIRKEITNIINTEINKLQLEINKLQLEINQLQPEINSTTY